MSKKYRVPSRRGVPWALLGAITLAVYLLFFVDIGEYNIYVIVVTVAVFVIWLARYFRKKNISRRDEDISSRLSMHHNERKERDDFNLEVRNFKENQGEICEYCGAVKSQQSRDCENCGKSIS